MGLVFQLPSFVGKYTIPIGEDLGLTKKSYTLQVGVIFHTWD